MSTSPNALPYPQYYNPTYTGGTVPYSNTTNPVNAAQNQRAVVQSQGDMYQNQDQQLANEYAAQQGGTQNYLAPIENQLATGQGGYTSGEASQIELTPQQQQDIVTGAGISSGVNTAASVGAAERAAAAAGGNPEALATYRARAAQTQGANAGNAETQARIQAQQAGAQGAEAVGNAQIAQQNQALGYYGNLQAQQGQQAQSEQGLGQSAYGTETQGTTAATDAQIKAAQLPTTSDKIIGGIAGAASAFLEDGSSGYLDDGMEAVVGEDGPEAIVKAASDPVRSNTKFMADGDVAPDSVGPGYAGGVYSDPYAPAQSGSNPTDTQASAPGTSWLQRYLSAARAHSLAPPASAPAQQWNKATPYQQLGSAIGTVGSNMQTAGMLADGAQAEDSGEMSHSFYRGSSMMAEGGLPAGFHWSDRAPKALHTPHQIPLGFRARKMTADGGAPMAEAKSAKIVTTPTRVHLEKDDMVVPLTYRPKAKVRPSAALPALAPMMNRGGLRATA